MKGVSKDAMKAWNCGLSLEEAVAKYGTQIEAEFQILESIYGCASIPVPDLLGYTPKPDTDPKLLEWRGEIGQGKLLKDIIAADRLKEKE